MTLREAASRIAALEQGQAELLRLLRRGRTSADEQAIQALVEYIHDEFAVKPWTVAMVLEAASENPVLLGAIKRCLGQNFSVHKLSRLLTRSAGICGELELLCVDSHSREGALFSVTDSVTRSQKARGNVSKD
jgi:hypothetical protein